MSVDSSAGVDVTVGIVTVTFNSGTVLPEFLDSIAAQVSGRVKVRLYAIDSGSSDNSLKILKSYEDEIDLVIVPNETNIGIAVGNNQGIVRAIQDGMDWVLTLNNDTVVPPTAVQDLVQEAEEHNLDVVSPLIEATEPAGSIWYAGGDIVRWQGMKPTHEFAGENMSHAPQMLRPVAYASTCCLLVNPRVFEKVGLMDPIYFVYFDDIDFAIRVVDAGFQFWLTPVTVILHKASSLTGGPDSPFFVRWRTRNWVVIARKHSKSLATLVALAYIQSWILARLVVGRDNWPTWKLRQKSFAEGLRVSIMTNPPRVDVGAPRT